MASDKTGEDLIHKPDTKPSPYVQVYEDGSTLRSSSTVHQQSRAIVPKTSESEQIRPKIPIHQRTRVLQVDSRIVSEACSVGSYMRTNYRPPSRPVRGKGTRLPGGVRDHALETAGAAGGVGGNMVGAFWDRC